MTSRLFPSFLLCLLILPGCSDHSLFENKMVSEAKVTDRTRAGELLANLPSPSDKVAVAVYDFQDQTGQFKYNDKFTDYSSAVTKGGHAILTKALLDAGNKQWFTVTERGGLGDLLKERSIIKAMRDTYRMPDGSKLPELPPILYGGLLIEGGIVSYDSNVITGGAGATYLGIASSAQYHRDMVTVYLRAVRIETGEVLLSVTSSKTIYSASLDNNLLKYITFDRLLQAEAGFSVNEPTQLAVRQAIETAVYSMIMEGAIDHLWGFKDPAAGQKAVDDYLGRRDGKSAAAAEKKKMMMQQQAQEQQAQADQAAQQQQQAAAAQQQQQQQAAQQQQQAAQQKAQADQQAAQAAPAPAPQAQPAPGNVPPDAIVRWKPPQP